MTGSKLWEGLAPDGGASGNDSLTGLPISGASPLPHLECVLPGDNWVRFKQAVYSQPAGLLKLV